MEAFASGDTDVLVATTVIEVGIDVPNATVMVIEGAERYGVSQLHQLRGRVGRGEHASHCLLFPEDAGAMARRRLKAVARERDGFKLAEVDLGLRGEGEVLGTRQHGLPRFAVAELPEDTPTLLEPPATRCWPCCATHGSLDAPGARPAARRRPPPLRRRRRRPDPALNCVRTSPCMAMSNAGTSMEGSMRVIAGELKGQRLVAPRGLEGAADLGPGARGDLLGPRRAVAGARVLDLYCGTGALAIEALSRGAAAAVLVDRDTRPALGNVERLGLGERVELVRADAGRWLATRAERRGRRRASTSSSSTPPIDSPTAWGRNSNTHLPRLLAEGAGDRRERRPPAAAARLAGAAAPAPLRRRRRRLLRRGRLMARARRHRRLPGQL